MLFSKLIKYGFVTEAYSLCGITRLERLKTDVLMASH